MKEELRRQDQINAVFRWWHTYTEQEREQVQANFPELDCSKIPPPSADILDQDEQWLVEMRQLYSTLPEADKPTWAALGKAISRALKKHGRDPSKITIEPVRSIVESNRGSTGKP